MFVKQGLLQIYQLPFTQKLTSRLRIAERLASGTCQSKECIRAASLMLDKMDPTVQPCENFYQFACGNYLSRNTVPDDHYLKSTIQTMQDDMYITLKKLVEQPISPNDTEAILKVKRLYTSCMNTSSIEDGSVKVLLELLTDYGIGEWPILNHKWNKSKVDLEWRLAMLHVHQVQPFFHTFVAPDDRNSSVYLLHVYSGSPILNTQYYLNTSDPDYVRYILSYKNLIAETVRLLKAQESVVKRDIESLLEFEVEFANLRFAKSRQAGKVVSNAVPLDLGSNAGEDMSVCKCVVPLRHGGTLNSRRATSPLVWLKEGEP
ncbi:membrane metallo-endopeptidase-like 1 [Trichonephila clavipes]|uniref:Membrane metallo-endopeptidase-like 1 n=1 Tax=Trichonephila clavipes TaxID=2585209 RepID=A0A8X6V1X3_TRICX|nr:membrane metallo-endopeptidase-like 1 [Trichonephila clavipes]